MQYQYLAYVFSCGWLMGMVFDFYNTVTGASRWLRWLRPILDLTFWCLAGVFVYYLTFITDDGRFRLYTFGLVLIGYAIYRVLLHHRVVGSAFAVVRLVTAICRLVWRTIDAILISPLRLLYKMIAGLARVLYRLLCSLEDLAVGLVGLAGKILFFPLRRPWRLVEPWYARFILQWEGMCQKASKWLKRGKRPV